jgi:hypothetical protein
MRATDVRAVIVLNQADAVRAGRDGLAAGGTSSPEASAT